MSIKSASSCLAYALNFSAFQLEEYWKRIKVLTWKRIQLKDREIIDKRRFTDGFFEVGGSLADKIGYMRSHGVCQERIAAHFGFKADT